MTIMRAFGLIFLAASLSFAGQSSSGPLRVLFIGNSYTYYNNLPEIFVALAKAARPGIASKPIHTIRR